MKICRSVDMSTLGIESGSNGFFVGTATTDVIEKGTTFTVYKCGLNYEKLIFQFYD